MYVVETADSVLLIKEVSLKQNIYRLHSMLLLYLCAINMFWNILDNLLMQSTILAHTTYSMACTV